MHYRNTPWGIRWLAALGLMAWVLAAHAAQAAPLPAQGDNPGSLCRRQTALQERQQGIPPHLLTAIAFAESGRWDEANRAKTAWPWTVTSGGEGSYFPTKAEAMAEVKRLKAKGVKNIDVGCMQVNLLYHPTAFASLDEAFDPATNVAYAAKFLSALFKESGSWTQAAAMYHSRDEDEGAIYRKKVVKLWQETQREAKAADDPLVQAASANPQMAAASMNGSVSAKPNIARTSPTAPGKIDPSLGSLRVAQVDTVRTAEINNALRLRRAQERAADPTQAQPGAGRGSAVLPSLSSPVSGRQGLTPSRPVPASTWQIRREGAG